MPTPREHLDAAEATIQANVDAGAATPVGDRVATGLLRLQVEALERDPAIVAYGKLAEIRSIINDPDPDADAGVIIQRVQEVLDRTETPDVQ